MTFALAYPYEYTHFQIFSGCLQKRRTNSLIEQIMQFNSQPLSVDLTSSTNVISNESVASH